MRGQPPSADASALLLRIIPARAGPTHDARRTCPVSADHPRSCGANAVSSLSAMCVAGSSPLVRGQPFFRHQFEVKERIIPARAGPTIFLYIRKMGDVDHPRSCGANVVARRRYRTVIGSSPLVRGQQTFITRNLPVRRIIPARAGPTRTEPRLLQGASDHPRSCGANVYASVL